MVGESVPAMALEKTPIAWVSSTHFMSNPLSLYTSQCQLLLYVIHTVYTMWGVTACHARELLHEISIKSKIR